MGATENKRSQTWALVPAAGAGVRFGGERPKQFVALSGKPLLHHTLTALLASPAVDGLVVALPGDMLHQPDLLPRELNDDPKVRLCAGGETRTDSVQAALAQVPSDCDLVLVHDGARPALSASLIERVVEGAREHGACVPVLPLSDTIKRVDGAGLVVQTLNRSELRRVQTPQGFQISVLNAAYSWLTGQTEAVPYTDDASLVEASGAKVACVSGEPGNIKVTVPADLRSLVPAVPRVGFGYDVHRLVAGRPLILGGVELTHDKGLLGHSDGDVALHALIDALLGAAGLDDIGRMFPDSDPAWAGADSSELLSLALKRIRGAGYETCSADLTIVAQSPRLADHLDSMAQRVAQLMGLSRSQVGCKATTEEGLGVSGEGQAIAAHAVAVITAQIAGEPEGGS